MTKWQQSIEQEAAKLIVRFERYARELADERRRRARRSTVSTTPLRVLRPGYWALAPGFDPYVVRARAQRIAHAIQARIRSNEYAPRSPALYQVPKGGGATRDVSVFQIADNAVSSLIFRQLVSKNRTQFSSRSYAYRDDATAHDAIQYVAAELSGRHRVFIAEYDFSRFFDNISHDYLFRIIRDRQFLLTRTEKNIITGFLQASSRPLDDYREAAKTTRTRGVPQGTSISLFLANVAAWELDRALERLGVSFVRYADDTLIWSTDYGQACRAAEAIHDISDKIGSPINVEKSGGVRLLVRAGAPAEFESARRVDYLGHSLALGRVSIGSSAVDRIKARVNQLLYFNLIREPQRGTQDPDRLRGLDRDYVTYIWQLRRYLYGDITERTLRRLQSKGSPPRRFKGVMSFFPLVDDDKQLEELDRWIVCQTQLALRKRSRLLAAAGQRIPPPHGEGANLPSYVGQSSRTGHSVDLRIPSIRRVAHVVSAAARRYGATRVARGPLYQYD